MDLDTDDIARALLACGEPGPSRFLVIEEATSTLSLSAFNDRFLARNVPALIRGACAEWDIIKALATPGASVSDYIAREYGDHDAVVPVASRGTTREGDSDAYGGGTRASMPLRDYLADPSQGYAKDCTSTARSQGRPPIACRSRARPVPAAGWPCPQRWR